MLYLQLKKCSTETLVVVAWVRLHSSLFVTIPTAVGVVVEVKEGVVVDMQSRTVMNFLKLSL